MPLAPHRALTDDQIETCRFAGIPPPPINCETPFVGCFDFQNPGDTPPIDSPISFRWRFDGRRLVFFGAYGRRPSGWTCQKDVRRKKGEPPEFYGILPESERDEHARTLLEDADV